MALDNIDHALRTISLDITHNALYIHLRPLIYLGIILLISINSYINSVVEVRTVQNFFETRKSNSTNSYNVKKN